MMSWKTGVTMWVTESSAQCYLQPLGTPSTDEG
jgi:hypothetical protein